MQSVLDINTVKISLLDQFFFTTFIGICPVFLFCLVFCLFVCLFVFFKLKSKAIAYLHRFWPAAKLICWLSCSIILPPSCLELFEIKLAHSTPKGRNDDLCQFASLLTVLKEKKLKPSEVIFNCKANCLSWQTHFAWNLPHFLIRNTRVCTGGRHTCKCCRRD